MLGHKIKRSGRPGAFYKKSVLRNFAKFTRKHLCQSLFFNKVAGLRPVVAASVLSFNILTETPWYPSALFGFKAWIIFKTLSLSN